MADPSTASPPCRRDPKPRHHARPTSARGVPAGAAGGGAARPAAGLCCLKGPGRLTCCSIASPCFDRPCPAPFPPPIIQAGGAGADRPLHGSGPQGPPHRQADRPDPGGVGHPQAHAHQPRGVGAPGVSGVVYVREGTGRGGIRFWRREPSFLLGCIPPAAPQAKAAPLRAASIGPWREQLPQQVSKYLPRYACAWVGRRRNISVIGMAAVLLCKCEWPVPLPS